MIITSRVRINLHIIRKLLNHSICSQWSRNEFEVEGGAHVLKFLVVPLHFLTMYVSVSTLMMDSTGWSVFCLPFFYSRCPSLCAAICKSGGARARPCHTESAPLCVAQRSRTRDHSLNARSFISLALFDVCRPTSNLLPRGCQPAVPHIWTLDAGACLPGTPYISVFL